MTNFAKKETYERLKKIAQAVYDQYGVDAIDFSNLLVICQKAGGKLGYNMAWGTYKNHLSKIIGFLKQIEFDNVLDKMPNSLLNGEITNPVIPTPELISIKFMYSDGTYEIRELKPKVVEQQTEVKPVEPEPIQWLGLFDYTPSGAIIIQKGKYIGCNVKSKASIMEYFKSISWFYKWSLGQIDKAEKNQIVITPHTPKDVETLKKIVNKIENSMNY